MRISVILEAISGSFDSDIQRSASRAEKRLQDMEKNVKTAMLGVRNAFAVAAAAAVVIGKLESNAQKFGSAIADAALQTGQGTTAIQELTYAGIQLGLTEDQLIGALTKLSVKIGEVRTEGDNAVPSFKRLGISVNEASGAAKSNEQIFREVVERLRAIEDPAVRASESFQIFGREAGPKFAELIAAGTAGLDAQADAARKAGKILDEEYIASLKRTSDEIAVLDRNIDVNLTRAFGTSEPLVKVWKETLDAATAALARWREENERAGQAVGLFGPGIVDDAGGFPFVDPAKIAAATNYLQVLEDIRAMGAPDGPIVPFALPGALDIGVPETDQQRKAREKAAEDAEKAAEQAMKAAEKEADAYIEAWELRGKAQREAEYEIEDMNEDAIVEENERLAAHRAAWDETVAIMQDEALPEIEAAYDSMSAFADEAARNMQSSFADFLFDPFKDGVDGMLKGFANTLRRMAAELASQAILKALFSGLASSETPWIAAIGNAFAKKAGGGPVSGGTPYIVGEEGPELFMPKSSGTIIPNGGWGGGGRSVNITYNVDAKGADPASAANMIRALLATKQQVKSEIYDEMRRGGQA